MKKILLGLFVLSLLVVGGKAFAEEAVIITVTSPNSINKIFEVGDKIDVKWNSNAPTGSFFEVYISNGTNKGEIVKTTIIDDDELEYTLGANLVPGINYKAYVSLVGDDSVSDSSDNQFTIKLASNDDSDDDANDDSDDDNDDDSDDDSKTEKVKEQIKIKDGCLPGYKFSPKTGEACTTEVVNDGCMKGYKFSPMTGLACPKITDDNKDDKKIDEKKTCTAPGSNCGVRNLGISRVLKHGIKGEDVKVLQSLLNLIEDGVFGPETKARLVEWQAKNGLTPDGVFGPQSRQKAEVEIEVED